MTSKLTAGMLQITASTARRWIVRRARSSAESLWAVAAGVCSFIVMVILDKPRSGDARLGREIQNLLSTARESAKVSPNLLNPWPETTNGDV